MFERAKPLFEKMGKNITLVGGVGDGQTAKVANQIIVGLTIEAVAEALTFAKKAGADPAKVREALMGGFAASRILEVHGERMIKRTFDPGFRIRLHRKDLSLAVDAAKALEPCAAQRRGDAAVDERRHRAGRWRQGPFGSHPNPGGAGRRQALANSTDCQTSPTRRRTTRSPNANLLPKGYFHAAR